MTIHVGILSMRECYANQRYSGIVCVVQTF